MTQILPHIARKVRKRDPNPDLIDLKIFILNLPLYFLSVHIVGYNARI